MANPGGWEAVREAVRERVGDSAFGAWFENLDAEENGRQLVIRCPDRFSRDWIRGRYAGVVRQAARSTGRMTQVAFEVAVDGVTARTNAPKPRQVRTRAPQPKLPLPHPADPSFESFVRGPDNALALEAARAVARGDAGRCSPLFITGESGAGKTHLCRAIRGAVRGDTVYRSSEEFTGEVTQAMRGGQMETVRRRYRRSLNVLILEDLQFLEGKRATQIELFHTLDHLITHGKTVVLSADRGPQDLPGIDVRLRSRIASGLVAHLGTPGPETALAILREKAASGGVRIPADCLEMLAARPARSPHELLSGLNQVVARASLMRRTVTPELVREALAAVEVPGRARTLQEIIELCARVYGVSLEALSDRSRKRAIVRPRQFAMYLCRRYTDASLKDIGRAFRRDHTSVIYAIDTVERRIVERPQLRYELEALVARISPGPRAEPVHGRGHLKTPTRRSAR
ncbi:MAG: chromosomal replication initiator protein DnaA [Myxococcota bacterium]|nr:chromosomal replication initiator protein DnaA [Myxococcota bacterium]